MEAAAGSSSCEWKACTSASDRFELCIDRLAIEGCDTRYAVGVYLEIIGLRRDNCVGMH